MNSRKLLLSTSLLISFPLLGMNVSEKRKSKSTSNIGEQKKINQQLDAIVATQSQLKNQVTILNNYLHAMGHNMDALHDLISDQNRFLVQILTNFQQLQKPIRINQLAINANTQSLLGLTNGNNNQ